MRDVGLLWEICVKRRQCFRSLQETRGGLPGKWWGYPVLESRRLNLATYVSSLISDRENCIDPWGVRLYYFTVKKQQSKNGSSGTVAADRVGTKESVQIMQCFWGECFLSFVRRITGLSLSACASILQTKSKAQLLCVCLRARAQQYHTRAVAEADPRL